MFRREPAPVRDDAYQPLRRRTLGRLVRVGLETHRLAGGQERRGDHAGILATGEAEGDLVGVEVEDAVRDGAYALGREVDRGVGTAVLSGYAVGYHVVRVAADLGRRLPPAAGPLLAGHPLTRLEQAHAADRRHVAAELTGGGVR